MSLQAPEPTSLEVSDGPAPLRPPPEAELVEAGKLTMGQLAQAHRDRLDRVQHVTMVGGGFTSVQSPSALCLIMTFRPASFGRISSQ